MNCSNGSVSSCGGRDGGDIDLGRRGRSWRHRCTAIVPLERQAGHEFGWILRILLSGAGICGIIGSVLLLLGQFHSVLQMNGMN